MIGVVNTSLRKVPVWAVYLAGMIPALAIAWMTVNGSMGIDPVRRIEHELGEFALRMFIASLMVTPLRKFVGVNLMKFRRALGLLAFIYVVLHLTVWLLLDMQLIWSEIWRDIWKRPYITIGMVSFALMVPLAITSNNKMVRRLGGAAWQKLHKLAYPAAVLGAVHFIMVQKVWEIEPLIYLGIICGLLALRGWSILPIRVSRAA